uniref:Uncharacterized protein LOC102803333 n=1 Tax=Saccoglossus kowalevskii TaxID=10224 RepID=A0ABM0M379_SACKO|nr:PREDICTED: uncharacterized protein LOC102803333 [Saccoglossus kowalevskii]
MGLKKRKRLICGMSRKHQEQDLQQRFGFLSRIVNRICHRKLYLRLPNDDECEGIDLEIVVVFSNDTTKATSNDDVIIEYSSVENAIRIVFSHFTSDKVDKGIECYFANIPYVIRNIHLTTLHALYDIDVLGCPEGKFGGNCQYECYCQNGATCHIFNGACKCTTGWKGIACDIVTSSVVFTAPIFYSYVGRALSFTCNFNHLNASDIYDRSLRHNDNILAENTVHFNNDTRIHIWDEYDRGFGLEFYFVADQHAGTYECNVVDIYGDVYKDYTTLIVTGCENNRWGAICDKTCNCENGGNCSRKDGCICSQGWNGTYCTEDVGAPEFVFCPQNITALLDEGSSSTKVTWPKIEVNDNSGLFNLTSNHQAGDRFIIGVHNILHTAVDNHGNTAICRFSVNVDAANIGTKKTVIVSLIVTSLLLVVLVTFVFVVCLRYRKNRLMYPLLFGRSEDDDDKEWDAFVAVKGGTEEETFVNKELLYELEENNDYKVNIHHRDFTAGIPIVENILYAIKNSRRTILILSPEFVRSEWCNYEVDQAKFEMFGLRHKLIPIMFEDVTHMGDEMSATLKSILDSINYLTWLRNGSEKEKKEFWKRLISAMPRKHQEQDLQQRIGFISCIVNRIWNRKLYLRLPNDDGCEEIDLEIM